MEKNYNLRVKGPKVVMEELKQEIVALASKVKRYCDRTEQFSQNRLFEQDEGRFCRELEKREHGCLQPDAEEAEQFWKNIWEQEQHHNAEAEWLSSVKSEISEGEVQTEVTISMEVFDEALKRLAPWKAPGPDGVQGFGLRGSQACI